MKFKSDIEVQAGLKDSSGAAGTSGQVLSSNGTTVSWVNAGESTASDVQNQVKAGVAINKGQAVYVTSADGTNIIVGLASNASEATSSKTLGLLNATVAANGFADVVQIGKLSGLNTSTATIGDPVWLGTGGNLIYGLTNKPYAPAHLVYIGVVTRVNANNGEIFITVQNGFELDELHNVSAQTPSNNNGIFYNTTSGLWEAKAISAAGGIEGSGTTNTLPKFTGASALGNSNITDTGSLIKLGSNSYVNGNLGIGSSNLAAISLSISRNITGAATSFGILINGQIQSDVTSARYFNTSASVASGTSITGGLNHFIAGQGTISGTVNDQTGFNVSSSLIGATVNYGFRGQIPSGTARWNLYMDGTAANHLAGNTLIGTTTDAGFRLDVNGTTRLNGLQTFQGTSASDTAPLGAELAAVTGTGTNWTLVGTDLNVGGYTHTTGDVTPLTTTLAAVSGTYYQITYTITGRTTGSITINYGGTATSGITATGATGPLASSTAALTITPTTDFNGTVVLSIKTIGNSSATTTFLNSSGTAANELRASNTTSNLFIGLQAGRRNTTGSSNTFLGTEAGVVNTTGSINTFLGRRAGFSNTIGISNTSVGANSLQSNTVGNSNTAIGQGTLNVNTTGSSNTAIGTSSLLSNTIGTGNSAVGISSLQANTTGNSNTSFGQLSLTNNTTGSNNVALGVNSGRYAGAGTTAMTAVSNSIYLGALTRGLNATGSTNEIVIGYDVVGLGSNTTSIGNSSTTATAIYGDLLLGGTTDNGTDKLQVTGTANITGQLKLGSTITNGTFTYTLPGATGTLALTSDLAGYVPTSRTITINGVTQDLSANRSWTVSGGVSGSGSAGQVAFWNGANSITGESNLFWDSTNDRLGIGTTSPNAKLDITDVFRVQSSSFSSPSTGIGLELRNVSGISSLLSYDRTNSLYKPIVLGGSDILLKYSGNNGIYLNSSGNVGIGTTSPNYSAAGRTTVDINGTSQAMLALSVGGVGKGFLFHTGTDLLVSNEGNGAIKLNTNGSQKVVIEAGGNVGIGTNSPAFRLTVSRNGTGDIGFFSNENDADLAINLTAGVSMIAPSTGILALGTASVERMRIFSSGNVFIGSSPTDAGYKLDVNGTGRFSGALTATNGIFNGFAINNTPPSAGTSQSFGIFKNTGGDFYVGQESSTNGGFFTGSIAYDNIFYGTRPYNFIIGAVSRLRIDAAGAATFSSTVTASGGFFNSDIRLKDLTDYDYNVSDIKPISYLWKDGRDNKKHVGYPAQEVQKVMPDAVNEDADGMLSVNYIEVLVAKIAELENRIKQLEK